MNKTGRALLLAAGLVVIGTVYVLRGLIVALDVPRLIYRAGYPFRQTAFSATALAVGLIYLAGIYLQRDFLHPKLRPS